MNSSKLLWFIFAGDMGSLVAIKFWPGSIEWDLATIYHILMFWLLVGIIKITGIAKDKK